MQRAEPVTSPREFDKTASARTATATASYTSPLHSSLVQGAPVQAWAPALRLVDPPSRMEPPAPGVACAGPFRLSECWWERPVERDYYQLCNGGGELLLVFHDLRDGQWYVQGIFD